MCVKHVRQIMVRYTTKGRGAAFNPPNRFERLHVDLEDEEAHERAEAGITTEFLVDSSRSILVHNDSPDVGFRFSVNPYRGCEHGCIYCYARPGHEFLGMSAGMDFETKILVKTDAATLLAAELSRRSWSPAVVAMSGVTDPYQPVERRLRLTRQCLEVLQAFRNPVAIVTKNHLVTRDIDILGEMATMNLAHVMVSITSLRDEVIRQLEPRTSRPTRRLLAIEKLASAGIPVGVLVAPVIPALTDDELPAILSAAAEAGASSAGYIMLRLPGPVKDLFLAWVKDHYPDRAGRIESRIRSIRNGRMSDPRFGHRMRGEGEFAAVTEALFRQATTRLGLTKAVHLDTGRFRRADRSQKDLFD